jgi:hypothetical protein
MRQHRQGLQMRAVIGFHEQFLPSRILTHVSFFITFPSVQHALPQSRARASPLLHCCSPLTEAAAVLSRFCVMKKPKKGCGWRSKVPWTCLCQLQIRSQTSKLVSGVLTRPSTFFQELSSKGNVEFCGTGPEDSSSSELLHYLRYVVSEKRASSSLVIDRSFYLKGINSNGFDPLRS